MVPKVTGFSSVSRVKGSLARDQGRRMAGAGSVRWRTQKLTFAATRYDPSAAGDRVSRTSSVGGCASDLPMFAGVQITFRRASNILSREPDDWWRRCPNGVATLRSTREVLMNLHLTIGPIVSLVAGILILMMPRLLNYIVAIYLIVIGLLGLFGTGSFHLQ
jgi:hypothetical protein